MRIVVRRISKRGLIGGVFATMSAVFLTCVAGAADQLAGAYTDPRYLLPWGVSSHWIQPWRAYTETVSAKTFVDGTGINFNVDAQQAENVATMLAKYGIHRARLDMNWGTFAYADENRLEDPALAVKLTALKRHGIRPLIVLNANSGRPCPLLTFRRHAAIAAYRGDTKISLDSVAGILVGYTGLSNVGKEKGAARLLIVGLSGNVATLSKPLPVDLAMGSELNLATLKYRPFSAPGTADFAATLKGWQTYVANVARIARADLGTTGLPDGGFDLEIWNELTFGSSFLSIDNYYSPAIGSNPIASVYGPIVEASAAVATSRPELFSGVRIGDGFANTIPWRAAAGEPARIDAIDKHPYKSTVTFPAGEVKGTHLSAMMRKDDYVPAYSVNFPEYWATAIRGDTIMRDMAPVSSVIAGKEHGRYARSIDGKIAPVTTWITEVNNDPELDNPTVTNDAALAIKAKTTARYFTFFLNKGVSQVDLYAVQDRNPQFEDRAMDVVRNDFMTYSDRAAAPYPVDDAPYVSPALLVTGRIVAKMKTGLDPTLTVMRPLHVNSLSATTDETIFHGDGSSDHPDLKAVDVFAFLPYEVSAHRFVIPYYVMTRDVTKSWPDDHFKINVSGFALAARFSSYDPFTDTTSAVASHSSGSGTTLDLIANDSPRLLVVDESAL